MATIFTRCRNPGWLMVALGLAILAFAPGIASAQLIDPATLHIGGTTTSGTGPVQLTTNDGVVTVSQQSGGADPLNVPWLLILGIPNVTTTTAVITKINGVTESPAISGTFGGSLTSSSVHDAYGVLGLGDQATDSNNWTNWSTTDHTINGITATSFGLFKFNIPVTLTDSSPDTLNFGNLPVGTFVIGYGETSKNSYETPFTEAGLTTGNGPPSTPNPTPEPSTLAIAGLGALGFVGYSLRRCLKK